MSKVIDNIEDIASIDSKATISYVDSKPTGFKNYIINGNFDVWQRKGKTQNTYIDEVTADRWKCTTVKDGVSHYAFLCGFVNNRANMPHNYMAMVVQDTNTNRIKFEQRVEQASFANKNVGDYITVSFYLGHNGTSYFNSSATMLLNIYSPTAADNWTSGTLEKTFTIGTIATMPEYGTKYTVTTQLTQNMISFGFNFSFSLYIPVGTAIGLFNSTLRVSNVQLEEGSVATPFEQRPYGLELSLCQRYYFKPSLSQVFTAIVVSSTAGGTYQAFIDFPSIMRITPTVPIDPAENYYLNWAGPGSSACSISTLRLLSNKSVFVAGTHSTSFITDGSACEFYAYSLNAKLEFSAEL